MSRASDPRRLRVLAGSRNLRDLGGYVSRGSDRERVVRWGCLYRSGHFGDLTPEGRRDLSALGVGQIIDFRTPEERSRNPNRFDAAHRPEVVELPIDPGSSEGLRARVDALRTGEGRTELFMEEVNRILVREQAPVYRRMFELLCADVDGARVIHCAAGKDRTGIGAALLLSALGVERGTVLDDFLLTNAVIDVQAELARFLDDYEVESPEAGREELDDLAERLRPMVEVRPAFLLAAFGVIEDEFGGMDAYLERELGVDASVRRRLAALYLET